MFSEKLYLYIISQKTDFAIHRGYIFSCGYFKNVFNTLLNCVFKHDVDMQMLKMWKTLLISV